VRAEGKGKLMTLILTPGERHQLSAYPNNPAARKAMRAQAK
jgi:hypothetical protein